MNENIKQRNLELIRKAKAGNSRVRQLGFDMVNFLLWTAGVVAVIGTIFGVFGPTMTTVKTNSLTSELQTFQQKIQDAYHGQPNGYDGISDAEVIKSNAYPTNLNATTTTLSSSSTGNITITSDDGGGQTFSILYDGVPSGVCRSIINKLATAGGWKEIDIGGTSIWSGTSSTPTKSAIDTACNAASTVAMKFISN